MIDQTSDAMVAVRDERRDVAMKLRRRRDVELQSMAHHSRKAGQAATPALRKLHHQKFTERAYACRVLDDLIADLEGRV